MPQVINITDEDIAYAEGILLPKGRFFDDERRAFISTNDKTLDLQAVPGSGKTTVLLAKLLIFEQKLPFDNGSGILVLSHTNAAIDEIKHKIQRYCPKLFSAPNFFGTIQAFVDQFLAIPYCLNKFKKSPYRINNDSYNEVVDKFFVRNLKGYTQQEQANARYFLKGKDCLYSYRFGFIDSKFEILNAINGTPIEIVKPRRKNQMNWSDFSIGEKSKVRKWMYDFKMNITEKGILHYDDAYFFGFAYLYKFPPIKTLLQKRFSLVFVDEMQDMDEHQYNLLENIFFDDAKSISIFQRIGDKNQSIYNSVKAANVWKDRDVKLAIKGSQRLSSSIADVINCFALYQGDEYKISGLNECALKPHILLYDTDSIKNVIPFFADIVNHFKRNGKLTDLDRYPVKAISWNTEWKTEEDMGDPSKIRLVDYHDKFKKDKHRSKEDYEFLKSYLLYFSKKKRTLEPVRKNILNALLKVLRMEGIEDEKERNYTKRSLLKYFKEKDSQDSTTHYETLKLHLYKWSIGIIRDNTNNIWESIKEYLPIFLSVFGKKIANSKSFISDNAVEEEGEEMEQEKASNCLEVDGLRIEITTVHSCKGQTHCATLYLESYFDKYYESQKLPEQFLGSPFKEKKPRHIETTKMVYVGLSRPTNLLCIAIHKDRFEKHLKEIDRKKWEVKEVSPPKA